MQETFEYIKQAFELKSQQCYKQAIEMLYKALEIESDNIEILFQLGELYFLLKNFARASQYLDKVIAKNENHIEALKILGKIASYSKDLEKACKIAEKCLDIDNSIENILDLINIYSKMNSLSKLDTLAQENDLILYAIAKAYYDNNKLDISKEYLEKALNINNENEDALVLLGKIYFDENEFDKSKNIFNNFSKTTENPEILNYLGLFALEDLKFIDAIKHFAKASSINKQNHKYLYNLANAYFYNGWQKEALDSYKKAICLAPENNGYRYSLAYLYYEQKVFDKAQKEIDYILEQDAEYPLAHVLNALLKFEKKDFLGAQSELENNIKNGINDNFTLVSLAKVYTELALFEKAETTLLQVLAKTQSLTYKSQLAEIYIAQKNYEKAIEIVDEILKENENFIYAYELGAKTYFAQNNLEKTKEFAQNSLSLDMNFASGYYYLSLVRFEEKDYDEAIECMKRAILYDTDNANYYAKMSEIYKSKEDFKSALEYIKEAESISPTIEYQMMYKELASLNRKNLTKK